MITGLSFYTLARAPQVPGTRLAPVQAAMSPPIFTHHATFWVIFLLPLLLHWTATCRAASGSWGFGCLSQGNPRDKSWERNVRHGGWQIFWGKRLNLVPLQSLHEMVELLVILKNSVTPYFLLQRTDLFFVGKWKELGFGSERSQSHPAWCLLAV